MLGVLHTGSWQRVVARWQGYRCCQMWEFSSRGDIHLSWPQASQTISLKRHWPNITTSVSRIQGWQDPTRKKLPRLFLLRRYFLLPSDTPGASLTGQNQTCFSLLCYKLSVLQLNSIWAISTRDFITLDSGEDGREGRKEGGRKRGCQAGRQACFLWTLAYILLCPFRRWEPLIRGNFQAVVTVTHTEKVSAPTVSLFNSTMSNS